MKIDPAAPQRPTPVRRGGPGGKAGGFAKALSDSAPSPGVSGNAPLGGINAMFALQEVADATDGRTRARRRGEQMLDRLEDIRLGLLLGAVPRAQLEELAGLTRARREPAVDSRLAELLDEIEVRAAVELAKLSRQD